MILTVQRVPVHVVITVYQDNHRVPNPVVGVYIQRRRVLLDLSFVKVVQQVTIVFLEQLHPHSVLQVQTYLIFKYC